MSSRHPKAWLGGVCATVADTLNFSTLGVRVVTVILAFIWPLLTLAAYLIGAFVLKQRGGSEESDPFLRDWDRRMADYDRRTRF
ncbi:MAG: PspC domain-containing protein [Pseudomonadota bacterium]